MSLQIASLSVGSGIVSPAQQEKKLSFPGEQRTGDKSGPSLLGSRKSEAPDLAQTAADLEKISLAFNRRLKFEIDHESKEIIVKVIDNETDKVIKVLPPEELQRLHSRIRETLGFLFDEMV